MSGPVHGRGSKPSSTQKALIAASSRHIGLAQERLARFVREIASISDTFLNDLNELHLFSEVIDSALAEPGGYEAASSRWLMTWGLHALHALRAFEALVALGNATGLFHD